MNQAAKPVIHTKNLHRIYHLDGEDIHAINDVSLEIFPEQTTAIVGRSGSGKTTLLNLMSGLDDPTQGEVWFADRLMNTMDRSARQAIRRENIGFVFQTFGLLPLLNALENVTVPLWMKKMPAHEREQRAKEALEWVGLEKRMNHRPHELSGGEQQRVSMARALAANPKIIMADEPTGQLDSVTGARIMDLFSRFVKERKITLIVITHDPMVIAEANIVHELHDGQLVGSHVAAHQ